MTPQPALAQPAARDRAVAVLLYTTYFIYFFCGLTQCFEGVFLPEFKEYFRLNYEQQMYTMFAKNIPFLLAVGIGAMIARVGYKNCMTVAMMLFAAGTFLLVPGLSTGRYEIVLLGFFLIGLGFNCEIVAGNPLLVALGPPEASSSRLNLGNALGAVAQIIAPATLSFIIPAVAVSAESKLPYMKALFVILGGVLLLTAVGTAAARNVDISATLRASGHAVASSSLWRQPKLIFGFLAIFLILGAEAGLFGLYRNYLEDPSIAGLSSRASQQLFTIYFAVFAAGRLAASWVQKRIRPATHLAVSLAGAILCIAACMFARGVVAIVAVTAVGFFVSIFFPTLYSLAIEGMGDLTARASGLLTMGFVGCAVLPVIQGRLADRIGLQHSYAVALVAYVIAVLYVLRCAWPGRALSPRRES